MPGIRNIYVEVSPLKNGVAQTVRMCRAGASSAATLSDGFYWTPSVTKRLTTAMSLASDGLLSAPDTSIGSLELNLGPDLGNEEWVAWEWYGALARVWIGYEGDPLSSYHQEYEGPVGSINCDKGRAVLPLLGPEAQLTANLLSLTYAGTGGAEGPPAMMGDLKPRAFGFCETVAPVQVDPNYLVYQVHGYGPVDAIPAVYDFGIALDPAKMKGDAPSYAALIAMPLVRGEWATCLAQGLFRLGAQGNTKISADVSVGVSTIASIGARLLKAGGVLDGKIGAMTGFNKPWALYQTEQVTVLEAARSAFLQGGGYLYADGKGVWQTGDYFAPKPAIRVADDGSTLPVLKSMKVLGSAAPVWKVNVGFRRCWDVHGESDVSPAIAQVTDLQLAQALAIEAAQEQADLALADAQVAAARIDAADSDGILTPSEKLSRQRDLQQLQSEYSGLVNQGSQFNVTAQRAAYVSAYQALLSYIGTYNPPLTDEQHDTTIDPAVDAQKWNAVWSARAGLMVANTGHAATTALNSAIYDDDGKKPEANATNSANPFSAFGNITVGAAQTAISTNTSNVATLQSQMTAVQAAAAQVAADAHQTSSDLVAEANRAKGAEGTLTTNLANLSQTVTINAGTASTNLNSQVLILTKADSALGVRIDNLTSTVGQNTSGLSQEVVNRTNAVSAANTRLDNQYADYTNRDSNTNSRINSEATTRANGDSAITSLTNTLVATAQPASINANTMFSVWPDGQGIPSYWNGWDYSGGAPIRAGGINGRPYSLQFNAAANVNCGVIAYGQLSFGAYIIELSGRSTDWTGAACLVQFCNASRSTGLYGAVINCAAQPDTSGYTSGDGGGGAYARSWSMYYQTPIDGGVQAYNIYAMANWDGVGQRNAKTIYFDRVSIRSATSSEMAAQRADANANTALAQIGSEAVTRADHDGALGQRIDSVIASANGDRASITTVQQATAGLSNQTGDLYNRTNDLYNGRDDLRNSRTDLYNRTNDLYNRTTARWSVTGVAGNNRAQLSVYADSNGGAGVDIVGDVHIGGNLVVDGSLTTSKYANNSITKQYFSSIGQEVVGTNNWDNYCATYFHLDYPADIILIATGSQNYYGWVPDYESALYLDGMRGAGSSGGAGAYYPSWALSASWSQVGPGDHVAYVPWRGGGDGIHLSACGLTVLRAYA